MRPQLNDLLTPPRLFAAVSLLLIVATLLATSFTQARFFRDAVIDREAVIVRDMAHALVLRELAAPDMESYADPAAQVHFERSVSALKSLSGVVRIKIFDHNGTIVWSDEPRLVGKHRTTAHEEDLEKALGGTTRAVLNPAERPSHAEEGLPAEELIEFYIPFSVLRVGSAGETVRGAISIYRLARELNDTIRRGLLLLWLVKGAGGAILFVAIFTLFNAVYRRQQRVESQFAKLSSEHERIVQMEKLSAMGRMAAEIAHQFNNPLIGVLNLAQLAERNADKPEKVRSLLGEIRQAGEHCRDFVGRMLRFTQASRSEFQPVELAALAGDTAELFRQSSPEHSEVVLALPAAPADVQGDPVLLRHALFNLLDNAARAAPGCAVEVALASGDGGWRISVADRGPGLSPEVMENLFTPFFTTRKGGTGLGLSVARHVAVQHGGRLWAENRPEGGAVFHFWIPVTRDDEDENTAG
ncbi:MAG: HAMP domain-containing histidine kinase [Candidatus Nitricoxidivorans perseverans]|uniref:histidine kinase n=1 Tax=Candidatus Nitricoxidivorans perseverans TaxID=2975601 RepID=A0AA49FLW2_9PROT|nr:MAG: HAMP domain-containing histidine kinase [Candidatus Nitricoxidivorans perseverans]